MAPTAAGDSVRTLATLGVVFAAALAVIPAAICCIPPSKPAKLVTATDVYLELLDAGCMAADPVGGVSFIAAEHTLPDEELWLKCLFDGGSISLCKPCAAAGTKP